MEEVPLCYLSFLNDLEAAEILLAEANFPSSEFVEPRVFSNPVPLVLASCWEAFLQRCASESTAFLAHYCESPRNLPKDLRRIINDELKPSKDPEAAWNLSGDNWRQYLVDRVNNDSIRLRTGKRKDVDTYFLKTIGIPRITLKLGGALRDCIGEKLDEFVDSRNNIAHNAAGHLTLQECWEFRRLINIHAVRITAVIAEIILACTKKEFTNLNRAQLWLLNSSLTRK